MITINSASLLLPSIVLIFLSIGTQAVLKKLNQQTNHDKKPILKTVACLLLFFIELGLYFLILTCVFILYYETKN